MLTIHKGYDVGYLTGAVGSGGANYYLSATGGQGGEPPGFWTGQGAEDLGLSGDVDPDVMRALYHQSVAPDGRQLGRRASNFAGMRETVDQQVETAVAAAVAAEGPFITPERIGEIRNMVRGRLRNAVQFFDFTYSAAKSVSVAHAGYLAAAAQARSEGRTEDAAAHQARADLIIDALRETAREVVAGFERDGCYTRTGHHGSGEGEWRDGRGVTAAVFVQHTSREGDPQLHAHIAVLNKVQRADGADDRHRALDSRSVFRERLGIAANGDRIMAQKLAQAGLPLVQRADGNGMEIGGIREDTMRAFSSRRTQVTTEIETLVREYTAKHGRAPTRRALWEMRQWAALQSRKGKEHARSGAEELAAWEQHATAAAVQALADLPGAIEAHGAQAGAPAPLRTAERSRAIRIAIAEVQRQNATWTRAQLKWELHRALPVLPADVAAPAFLDQIADEALAQSHVVPLAPAADVTDVSVLGVRESDGESIFRAPGGARFATVAQLDTEDYLLRTAARRIRPAMTAEEAGLSLARAGLAEDQLAAAIGLLSSDRALVTFVGPAGTGKTHTIAAFARAWTERTGNRVIGLTSATNAARVMASEGLAEAFNLADFLGKIKGSDETRGNIAVYRGDVLVIDEASQLSTADLAAVLLVAERYGARVILTGDTEQLTSPDAGGAMRLIASEHGYFQLHEVRRFASEWERPASLRLRDGDTGVITVYQRQGRIREGSRETVHAGAVRLWLADFLAGRDTLLMAASNAEAAELAADARHQLVALGRVAPAAEVILSDGNDASTGDLIRARENSKINAGGQKLANRDTLRITGWQGTGPQRKAVMERRTAEGEWTRPFLVPQSYLTQSAELAYAGNTHVAEGRTVDTAHLVVSDTTDREGLYVGATRGRQTNTLHVVTHAPQAEHVGGNRPAPELSGEAAGPEPTTAEAVLTAAMSREADDLTATEVIRQAQDRATSLPHLHAMWKSITRGQSFRAFDDALRERLSEHEYDRYIADPERPVLQRQLRAAELAGLDVGAILDEATAREMTGARSVAAVLHGRVAKGGLTSARRATTWADRTPPIADQRAAEPAAELASAMDHRQFELGAEAADKPPVWAVRYLGVPPRQPGALRDDWIARVGQVAGYRELTGHTDPVEAIGALPETGSPELREAHIGAAAALEMQSEERGVRAMGRGDLEARVRVYERALPWQPAHVADELRATTLAEADTRAQAEVSRAQHEASGSESAARMARSADELAGILAERRAKLSEADAARQLWHDATAVARAQAAEAAEELRRREPAAEHQADAEPAQQPEREPQQQAESAGPESDLDAVVERARAAADRIRAERESAREAEAAETDLEQSEHWRAQADAQRTATWQPGRVQDQPEPAAELESELEAGG